MYEKGTSPSVALEALAGLQDMLHEVRKSGRFVDEANLVEKITGHMRHTPGYGLDSTAPEAVDQEIQGLMKEMMKKISKMMKKLKWRKIPMRNFSIKIKEC